MPSLDATRAAIALHQAGRLDEALSGYQRILERDPECADACHFLGLLHYQRREVSAALDMIRRALRIAPGYGDAHANLAIILIEIRDYTGAERHLEQALQADRRAIEPRITLARLRRARGKPEEAEAVLREAMAIDPAAVKSRLGPSLYCGLGNALMAQGRLQDALEEFRRGVVLDPGSVELNTMIGHTLCRLGWFEQAAQNYREQLERNPDDANARHMLAACGGSQAPSRASDQYVRETFDHFANSFDSKLQGLGYRAPALVAEVIRSATDGAQDLELLDAGCGTGLLGTAVRPDCRRLIGVDLSPGMLQRARERGIYDELHEGELTAWIGAHSCAFQVIASADTLCYFGSLREPLAAAYRALRDGGWLCFTVEHDSNQAGPHRLQSHGRFAHRRDYIETELYAAGFDHLRVTQDTLRKEDNLPVEGLVVAARK